MKAVWSFWSKPYLSGRSTHWLSEKHHWLSWVLSLEAARQHYPETCLYTDCNGAEMLVDQIGLHFSEVCTDLDKLAGENPQWWALGKLYAYNKQQAPFVHIDSDVYLWKRLPQHLESADVFVQNPEPFSEICDLGYRPQRVDDSFRMTGGHLPDEWLWYRRLSLPQRGECCGILGGRCTGFIRHYAEQALRFALEPENGPAWNTLGNRADQMTLVEQYLLAACVEFHFTDTTSAFNPIRIRYLFDTLDHAFRSDFATRAGFTHLIGNAKKNRTIAENLEKRVKQDYPQHFERCKQFSRLY